MTSVNFRKIDVDALDPDNAPQPLAGPFPPVTANDISARASQVKQLLSKGDSAGALGLVLEDPPYGGDEHVKSLHLKTVLDVLTAVRSSEIGRVLEQQDAASLDVLVKYLYKGMGSPIGQSHGNGGVLLSWFDKTVEVTGQGSIIRYLADRRTV